jgi:hypothetical protein
MWSVTLKAVTGVKSEKEKKQDDCKIRIRINMTVNNMDSDWYIRWELWLVEEQDKYTLTG